jgi:hypothetical protein
MLRKTARAMLLVGPLILSDVRESFVRWFFSRLLPSIISARGEDLEVR